MIIVTDIPMILVVAETFLSSFFENRKMHNIMTKKKKILNDDSKSPSRMIKYINQRNKTLCIKLRTFSFLVFPIRSLMFHLVPFIRPTPD